MFVDGALWRARPSWPDGEQELAAGDAVVVERVSGLTLAVRRAEEWEEPLIEVVLIVLSWWRPWRPSCWPPPRCGCCASTSAAWCSGSAA